MQLEENIAKQLAAIIKSEMAICIEECKRLIAELPRAEKGDKGEKGDRGERGLTGEPGLVGPQGIAGRDGLPGVAGRDGKDGAPGLNGKDGAPGAPGINGKDGRDGIDANLRAHFRGPWKQDRQYAVNDTVQYGGSAWICMVDNPKGKPEDKSGDWQLFVKRGRDGKDGERGPPGPMGPAGKNASY